MTKPDSNAKVDYPVAGQPATVDQPAVVAPPTALDHPAKGDPPPGVAPPAAKVNQRVGAPAVPARRNRPWVTAAQRLQNRRADPVPGSLPDVAPTAPVENGAQVESPVTDQDKLANNFSSKATPASATTGTGRGHLSPFKWGFFGGIGVLLAFIVYNALDTLRGTLIVLAIAALLAIGLDPLVTLLIKRGIRRGFAVLLVMLLLFAFLAAVIYAVLPPIISQVAALITDLPSRLTSLLQNQTIQDLDQRFHIIDQIQNALPGAGTVVAASISVAGVIFDLFVVLILTLYFLAGFPRIKRAAFRLAPASRRERVTALGEVILRQMGGYLGGATLIALQAGVVAGVFATIVGLPYPWAIALAAAVLDFVPVIGPIVVGVSMMLLGFTISVTVGIIAAIFYLLQHLFEVYLLYPKVMHRTVSISAAAVVVAILVGGALLGVTGALMAVPVAAAIQLIIREVVYPMQDDA